MNINQATEILLEGYETDRVKATQDIQKYGKQYIMNSILQENMT